MINEKYFNSFLASSSEEYIEMEFSSQGKENNENDLKYFNNTKNIKKEIIEAYSKYNNVIAFEFDALSPNEERNLFMSFNTTNEMLQDTNVSISIQSIFYT